MSDYKIEMTLDIKELVIEIFNKHSKKFLIEDKLKLTTVFKMERCFVMKGKEYNIDVVLTDKVDKFLGICIKLNTGRFNRIIYGIKFKGYEKYDQKIIKYLYDLSVANYELKQILVKVGYELDAGNYTIGELKMEDYCGDLNPKHIIDLPFDNISNIKYHKLENYNEIFNNIESKIIKANGKYKYDIDLIEPKIINNVEWFILTVNKSIDSYGIEITTENGNLKYIKSHGLDNIKFVNGLENIEITVRKMIEILNILNDNEWVRI